VCLVHLTSSISSICLQKRSALVLTEGNSDQWLGLVFFLQGCNEITVAVVEMRVKSLTCAKAS